MADVLKANAKYIGEFGDYLHYHVHPDIGTAASQASGYGCVKDGFTGLLLPLQPAMDRLSDLVDQAGNIMGQKMTGTYQGLYATANDYAGMDATNARNLTSSAVYAPPGGSFGGFVAPATGGTFADAHKVELKPPTVEKTNLGDVLKDGDRWASDAINWVVRNFSEQLGLGGKDLYDVLVKPISGDFNQIRANGAAWEHASTMFWNAAGNLSENAEKLTGARWGGKAGDAFDKHVNLVWTPAFWIIKQTCTWMKKGFDKLAEVSIRIATKCANLLNQILERIGKLFTKWLPVAEIALGAWEWVKNGFKFKDLPFPAWDDVMAIKEMIQTVLKLHEAIKTMVEQAKAYFEGFKQVIDAVSKIPDIDSTHRAIDVVEGFKTGSDQMKETEKSYQEADKERQKQIDALNRTG